MTCDIDGSGRRPIIERLNHPQITKLAKYYVTKRKNETVLTFTVPHDYHGVLEQAGLLKLWVVTLFGVAKQIVFTNQI